MVKDPTGFAACFYSARKQRLPDWVRVQIWLEAGSFEMVQHILLGESLEYLSSFSDTGTSHSAHVLATVLGDGYHQRGYPGSEKHHQTTAKKAFLAVPKEMCNEIKGCRSTRNYQSNQLSCSFNQTT